MSPVNVPLSPGTIYPGAVSTSAAQRSLFKYVPPFCLVFYIYRNTWPSERFALRLERFLHFFTTIETYRNIFFLCHDCNMPLPLFSTFSVSSLPTPTGSAPTPLHCHCAFASSTNQPVLSDVPRMHRTFFIAREPESLNGTQNAALCTSMPRSFRQSRVNVLQFYFDASNRSCWLIR